MSKKVKEISHEEISDAMARFLKKGGVINKIEYNDNPSNQVYYEVSRKPIWSLELGNHILTITDIK